MQRGRFFFNLLNRASVSSNAKSSNLLSPIRLRGWMASLRLWPRKSWQYNLRDQSETKECKNLRYFTSLLLRAAERRHGAKAKRQQDKRQLDPMQPEEAAALYFQWQDWCYEWAWHANGPISCEPVPIVSVSWNNCGMLEPISRFFDHRVQRWTCQDSQDPQLFRSDTSSWDY